MPFSSKSTTSIPVAFSDYTAKLTPCPSTVARSGACRPGLTVISIAPSKLAKSAGDRALELGKVSSDHRYVEAPQNRLLRFALEQELAAPLHEHVGRFSRSREPLEVFFREG